MCLFGTIFKALKSGTPKSLNPCYTGCASSAVTTLYLYFSGQYVLILVILDVPLRPACENENAFLDASLNPCYTGCASSARLTFCLMHHKPVLILVILDVPLRHSV